MRLRCAHVRTGVLVCRCGHGFVVSRRDVCARVVLKDLPSQTEGAGTTGRWPHPWPACNKNSRRQVPQVQPRQPGSPRAMVGTAASRSPRCSGLFGHRRPRDALASSRPWHQRRDARTTRLDRAHQRRSSAQDQPTLQHRHAHRIPHPTSVTTAKRPLMRGGTGRR